MVIENKQKDTSNNLIPDVFKDFSERQMNDIRLVDTDLQDPTMVKNVEDELQLFKKFRALFFNAKAEGNEATSALFTGNDQEHFFVFVESLEAH